MSDLRMEFVELLSDCDAHSFEKAERAEEVKVAGVSVFAYLFLTGLKFAKLKSALDTDNELSAKNKIKTV